MFSLSPSIGVWDFTTIPVRVDVFFLFLFSTSGVLRLSARLQSFGLAALLCVYRCEPESS